MSGNSPGILAPGKRLGHYTIGKKLGGGGMGVVYEAADERLARTVAIKVLPPSRTGDEEARKRFQREAQSASALNHPGIVTVYDVGRDGDIDFIAMEKVSGRTLRELIAPRGMDARTAIGYCIQIADALAAAHEAGLVHRDLKPGNVMVTERGQVKVLDFGLAKKAAKALATGSDGVTLTLDDSLTGSGQIVGTLAYMAPEQVEGKDVDARCDIFAFGCLMYEMLTGRRPFDEESAIRTAAAVLGKDPKPLHEAAPALPQSLGQVLHRCLQKKPMDRWQHMSDVKLLLEDSLKELNAPPSLKLPAEAAAGPRPWWFGWGGLAAAGLLGALAAAALFVFRASSPESPETPRLHMVTSDTGLSTFPALSRDGKLLAFASDRGKEGNLDIWVQQIGGQDPIRLTSDPADESDPSFSPDGTRVAFRSERDGGGIYVVPALGGTAVLLARGGREPRFSPDGRWVAYWTGRGAGFQRGSSQIFAVEAGGGQPKPVHPEMAAAVSPIWSPRGDALLVLGRLDDKGSLESTLDWWLLPLEERKPVKTGAVPQFRAQNLAVLQLASQVRPVALDWTGGRDGRLLFAALLGDAANLWEIGLSESGEVSGPARPVTQGPGRHMHAVRAVSEDTERLAFSYEELNFDVWTIPVDAENGMPRGDMKRVTEEGSVEWAPSISRDARKLAYLSRQAGNWWLRLKDLTTGSEETRIANPIRLVSADISGDGSRLAYSNLQGDLFSVAAAGGTVDKLCDQCGTLMGVSADGSRLLYEPLANEDLMMIGPGRSDPVKLAAKRTPDDILSGGQFSPDGKWVAFHSINNQTSTAQVWVAAFDEKSQIPASQWIGVTDGTTLERDPCWSPGGSLLYFLSERDGFRCIWARRLDQTSKRPSGEAFAVRHFHSARWSLRRVGFAGYLTGLSLAAGQMVFALGELRGNIWMEEKARGDHADAR